MHVARHFAKRVGLRVQIVVFALKHALLSQACDANSIFPVNPAACFIGQSQSGGPEYKHRHVSSQPNSRAHTSTSMRSILARNLNPLKRRLPTSFTVHSCFKETRAWCQSIFPDNFSGYGPLCWYCVSGPFNFCLGVLYACGCVTGFRWWSSAAFCAFHSRSKCLRAVSVYSCTGHPHLQRIMLFLALRNALGQQKLITAK